MRLSGTENLLFLLCLCCYAFGSLLSARTLIHWFQLESYQFPGYFRTLRRQGIRAWGIGPLFAAILLAARSGSADSSTGTGIEFTGIIACVLSGVALKGGEGTLWKAIVAVFVLGVLSNGMQLINLGTYPQYIAKGIIMLVSLYLSNKTAKKA